MDHHEELRNLIANSSLFTSMLRAVRVLDPPYWVVGAGAVRSLVWNHLHGYGEHATFRDVDVAFFDPEDLSRRREIALEGRLRKLMPEVPWEVKNQAAVHLWYERKFGLAVEPSCRSRMPLQRVRRLAPVWAYAYSTTTTSRSSHFSVSKTSSTSCFDGILDGHRASNS
jgi:hypothetical protein